MQTASKYTDETLQFIECSGAFIFSAGEQHFHFDLRGWANKPRRCEKCRKREDNGLRHLRGPDGERKALQLAKRIATNDETLVVPAPQVLRRAIGILSESSDDRAAQGIDTLTLA